MTFFHQVNVSIACYSLPASEGRLVKVQTDNKASRKVTGLYMRILFKHILENGSEKKETYCQKRNRANFQMNVLSEVGLCDLK